MDHKLIVACSPSESNCRFELAMVSMGVSLGDTWCLTTNTMSIWRVRSSHDHAVNISYCDDVLWIS